MADVVEGVHRLEPLILASASPRRAELLAAAGYRVEVAPAAVDESAPPDEPPLETCLRLAESKAAAVAATRASGTVIAGDTLVVVDGEPLGKPADAVAAETMLRRLSGRAHEVASAAAVVHVQTGRRESGLDTSTVVFDRLDDAAVADCVASGEWSDKAGGYAIQGRAAAFARVEHGRRDTVVGLSMDLVRRLLVRLLAALALACSNDAATEAPPPRTAVLDVAGNAVTVDLAADDLARARGLMHRTRLDDDEGMLFVFPDSKERTFWMRNTLIALDIVFLDEEGVVLNIEEAPPAVERPGFSSRGPARFVLELRRGWSRDHGLRTGQQIVIAPEIAALAED